ncbi:MAG: hypothetical protein HDQ88_12010 [Clostridia bacterium]|nr:hypothetical protein [Clostridia bacterium]
MYPKVYIMKVDGRFCCVLATNEFSANQYIAKGAVEVPEAEAKEIFGDHIYSVGPSNTSVDEDGKIFFMPPPDPEPEPEVPTEAELHASLEKERGYRLYDYDNTVSQIQRVMRNTQDETIISELTATLAAWDAYATALCRLPSQDGSPWDGGGENTPWPTVPEKSEILKNK